MAPARVSRVTLSPLPITRGSDVELAVKSEETLVNLDAVYGYDLLSGSCVPKVLVPTGAQIAMSASLPRSFSGPAPLDAGSAFDKNRVVSWYIPPLVVRDVSPALVPGTKVIRLKASPKNGLVDVFYWDRDRYRVTAVPVDSLSSSYISSNDSLSNALNDLSHIRSRMAGNSIKFDKVLAELNFGAITLSSLNRAKFLDRVVSFNAYCGVDVDNKPLTMERSLNLITLCSIISSQTGGSGQRTPWRFLLARIGFAQTPFYLNGIPPCGLTRR